MLSPLLEQEALALSKSGEEVRVLALEESNMGEQGTQQFEEENSMGYRDHPTGRQIV